METNPGHPPCEDVSWNNNSSKYVQISAGHPPCEDVSWNIQSTFIEGIHVASSSLWGCELKCCDVLPLSNRAIVILLVRMWVEITLQAEVKEPAQVILLVRMWVEILSVLCIMEIFPSSSLWGCELKYPVLVQMFLHVRHPPCEDVSWNSLFSDDFKNYGGHPPCEDVSWNITSVSPVAGRTESSSLWGCELKCYGVVGTVGNLKVILLVRMWVEMLAIRPDTVAISVILLVRMWVEISLIISLLR